MIRPHFNEGTITSLINEYQEFQVYPNPARDRIYIEGKYDAINLLDMMGRKVAFQLIQNPGRSELIFSLPEKQIVFLVLDNGGRIQTYKLLISN